MSEIKCALRQILLNLAGNGIKFTERGEVVVAVCAESQDAETACLRFEVRDTGIGIPPSELERVFQPFAQADPSTTRQFGGTGLGLTIASSLVGMMGGRIWVQSQPGQGSTFCFTVRLPFAKEKPCEPQTSGTLAEATSALRILLVEDNPANQKFAAYILRERGHTVEIVGNGRQALRMAQENQYNIILMDVQMPGMDGLEATKAIRAWEKKVSGTVFNNGQTNISDEQGKMVPDTFFVPIIAMTAHAMKGDRERCLAAGMDGYLSKPIDGREMIVLVESLAAGAAAPRVNSVFSPQVSLPAAKPPAALVFDPELALKRCLNSRNMLGDMIQCFFDEVDSLFPQMRSALRKGDLTELGRLGHRFKGTLVYLGAEPAIDAALQIERFEQQGGEQLDAQEAVRLLQQECEALKAALLAYQRTNGPKQHDF